MRLWRNRRSVRARCTWLFAGIEVRWVNVRARVRDVGNISQELQKILHLNGNVVWWHAQKAAFWFNGLIVRWKCCHAVLNAQNNLFLWRRLENSGSVTSRFLITEGAEAEERLKSALERRFFLSWYLAWTSLLVLLISTHHSILRPLTITHLWARVDHVIVACGNVLEVMGQIGKWSVTSLLLSVGVNSLILANQMLSVIHRKGVTAEICVNGFIYETWGTMLWFIEPYIGHKREHMFYMSAASKLVISLSGEKYNLFMSSYLWIENFHAKYFFHNRPLSV